MLLEREPVRKIELTDVVCGNHGVIGGVEQATDALSLWTAHVERHPECTSMWLDTPDMKTERLLKSFGC